MRQAVCDACNQSFAYADTARVFGKSMCKPCAEAYLREYKAPVPEGSVGPQADPTVCVQCKQDFGDVELGLLAGVPVCEPCARALRNRPYPQWVRWSFAGMLAVSALTFYSNWRFIAGYVEFRRAVRAFDRGNVEKASRLMSAASRHVPEDQGFDIGADFYAGVELLKTDHPEQALPKLRGAQRVWGTNPTIEYLIRAAEGSVAFEHKDYESFLRISEEALAKEGETASNLGQVASALACRYIQTGDESFRERALAFIEKAKRAKDAKAEDMALLEQRLAHRMESKEIIDSREFMKRFPRGWKKGEA